MVSLRIDKQTVNAILNKEDFAGKSYYKEVKKLGLYIFEAPDEQGKELNKLYRKFTAANYSALGDYSSKKISQHFDDVTKELVKVTQDRTAPYDSYTKGAMMEIVEVYIKTAKKNRDVSIQEAMGSVNALSDMIEHTDLVPYINHLYNK